MITKAISDRLKWEYGRLTISLPPRSLKSHIASVALPAFLLGRNPAAKIIVTSYNEALAADLAAQTRRLMESNWYRRLFPATRLSTKSRQLLETTRGGSRLATSIEGATTGFGGDYIIVDDPLSAANANSLTERNKANVYLDRVLMNRLNDPAGGLVLIVAQRLHEDDMIGHVRAQGGDWDHLSLPAIAKEDIHISSDVGGPYDYRKGELLHPARWPLPYLLLMRLSMGAAAFEAQYQQNPMPAEGTLILREHLLYHDNPPDRDQGVITLSVDTATKTDVANDYSVCSVWLEYRKKHYLLDVWRSKVTYPELKQKIRELWAVHRAHHLLIEDQGTGTVLIQELRTLGIPAIECRSRDSKMMRLSTVSDYFKIGIGQPPTPRAFPRRFRGRAARFSRREA